MNKQRRNRLEQLRDQLTAIKGEIDDLKSEEESAFEKPPTRFGKLKKDKQFRTRLKGSRSALMVVIQQ